MDAAGRLSVKSPLMAFRPLLNAKQLAAMTIFEGAGAFFPAVSEGGLGAKLLAVGLAAPLIPRRRAGAGHHAYACEQDTWAEQGQCFHN